MPWVLDEIIQAEVDRLKRLRILVDEMPPTNVTVAIRANDTFTDGPIG